jgi:phosphoenolpyruvate phosphomutase
VIARIESLVLNMGMQEAIQRAYAYVEAGADGILIHSRQKDAAEVFDFAERFKAMHVHVPLACVPTSYAQTHFEDLAESGFNIIIYANHMLRAAYPAMRDVAVDILRYGRTLEAEPKCLSINEILELIPGTK